MIIHFSMGMGMRIMNLGTGFFIHKGINQHLRE
jgi:hypothetical protein